MRESFCLSLLHIYLITYLWRQWVSHFVVWVGFKHKEILLFQPAQYRVIGVSHQLASHCFVATLFQLPSFGRIFDVLLLMTSCFEKQLTSVGFLSIILTPLLILSFLPFCHWTPGAHLSCGSPFLLPPVTG